MRWRLTWGVMLAVVPATVSSTELGSPRSIGLQVTAGRDGGIYRVPDKVNVAVTVKRTAIVTMKLLRPSGELVWIIGPRTKTGGGAPVFAGMTAALPRGGLATNHPYGTYRLIVDAYPRDNRRSLTDAGSNLADGNLHEQRVLRFEVRADP